MGTFGDCSFLNDIKDAKNGTIYIYFGVDANNYFKVELQVTPNNNVTVVGNVELKINGNFDVKKLILMKITLIKKHPFLLQIQLLGLQIILKIIELKQ